MRPLVLFRSPENSFLPAHMEGHGRFRLVLGLPLGPITRGRAFTGERALPA